MTTDPAIPDTAAPTISELEKISSSAIMKGTLTRYAMNPKANPTSQNPKIIRPRLA
jgi:hypothetical protein